MICPKCGSRNIGKDKTIRGWSGDYRCDDCRYSDLKSSFGPIEEVSKSSTETDGHKWKLKVRK